MQLKAPNDQLLTLVGLASLSTIAFWFAKKYFFGSPKQTKKPKDSSLQNNDIALSGLDFVDAMENQNRKVVIFYGSQTGSSEDLAKRLSKECKKRYGIDSLVTDPEQCDMKCLDKLPKDYLAIFVVSTYGEGEPTDNMLPFWDLLQSSYPRFSGPPDDKPLKDLCYMVFGLGNSTYNFFNEVSRALDKRLTDLGATRLGERGEGDDDKSLEDDYTKWEAHACPLIEQAIGSSEEPNQTLLSEYLVEEEEIEPEYVYHGQLGSRDQIIYDIKKPFPAPFTSRDLMHNSGRHCLHLEVDISGSNFVYETGDHLGIWPTNSEGAVEKTARIFGLDNKLNKVISVKVRDIYAAKKSPFPSPTTYLAMLRHYLDINQSPSRQVLASLAQFAPTAQSKLVLDKLVSDKEEYGLVVLDSARSLADVLEYALGRHETSTFSNVPPELLVECFNRLQPRYYSISSSSTESPDKISATIVTLEYKPKGAPDRSVYGVNTNYLWAAHCLLNNETAAEHLPTYSTKGPLGLYCDPETKTLKIPIHVRRSGFKLPSEGSKPIIMVGPGTGVAPFRGFVRERVQQKKQGLTIGTTLLFFGCRRADEDFLYSDEWDGLFKELGGDSRLITAFSRETGKKVYVQHRLEEEAELVWDLLINQEATLYVCGDGKYMAKDVQKVITGFAKRFGGHDDEEAAQFVDHLRQQARYQEDVWV
ncbi:NADPH-dependent cytochrome P450 oxidoreductase [Phycomyces nitens]|nr:NADPH-dependent cytochrome P450 oxidoreductase [Phycomyces nitens]